MDEMNAALREVCADESIGEKTFATLNTALGGEEAFAKVVATLVDTAAAACLTRGYFAPTDLAVEACLIGMKAGWALRDSEVVQGRLISAQPVEE